LGLPRIEQGLLTLWQALAVFATLTVVTGVAFPLGLMAVARAGFPDQAAGSLVIKDGVAIGSRLIGQEFLAPKYFWGRPSATAPNPYNAAASGGSNLGPLHPEVAKAAAARLAALRAADPGNVQEVPLDLLTTSGSGLDPHISVAAATYQAARVARARGVDPAAVRRLIAASIEGPGLGLLGEARVNVLLLNLALDRLANR
jgi:K+-transporting ATPase ATPase C chain